MGKRYRKMQRKANGKIREIMDGQVIIEMPSPIADALAYQRDRRSKNGVQC